MTILNSGRFGMAAVASGGIRKIIGNFLISTSDIIQGSYERLDLMLESYAG